MADLVAASKFMSFVLRHDPGAVGLVLDPEGWASVADLVARSEGRLSEAIVRQVVAESDKQRFALTEDGQEIRANQGHSIAVDLGLPPATPPEILYHGTATRFVASITRDGLKPRSRQFVHLSSDVETAIAVGSRHGKPVVLRIAAGRMHAEGGEFFVSQNGIWLTKTVPVVYIGGDAA
ncbi:MAG: RNA 2'-phosphotransferase [Paracoccaceae bacterium]